MPFELCLSPREYFTEIVAEACRERKIKTIAPAQTYLVKLLEFYMTTENLFAEEDSSGRKIRATLAESLLKAAQAERNVRIEMLKRLGDSALYISGFFGDSLQRKVVDIDYYADMGGTAYATLAEVVREDTTAQVYKEFAHRFLEFVDVLSHISAQAHLQSEQNILRLYENYTLTGSDQAREKLMSMGLITVPLQASARKKQ
jgi:hypothetical protein